MSARAPSALVAARSGPPVTTPWGETARTVVAAGQTGGAFAAMDVELPRGWRRPTYVHHSLDECFHVRAGHVRFHLEDSPAPVDAGPGDTVYVPRGLARSAVLLGAEDGALLLVQTPAPPDDAPPPGLTDGRLTGIELVPSPTPADAS